MATPPDRLFSAIVRLNGEEDERLHQCIESITVNEDLDRGSSFELRFTLVRNEDGSWDHLDDERLALWSRVTILAGFPERSDVVMDGYITQLNPATNPETGGVSLAVRGVDASYEMDLEEKSVVWTKELLDGNEPAFEEIARKIITSYGLRPVLPEASGGAAEAGLPAVAQRGTDRRFLRELARRKGYEFYVRGGDAHFHPPELTGTPQKLIAVHFGEETNCHDLRILVDGTKPTAASMTRIDPLTGEPESVTSTSSGLDPLGTTELSELRGYGIPQTTVVVRRQGAAGQAQMTAYVDGLLRRHGWWIVATGKLNGLRYGRVLRSKKLVTIKGFGRAYNGNYYVRKVTHKLARRSYSMEFEAVRNALGQLGTEDFTGEQPAAAALPVAAGAGADPDRVVVRTGGARVAPG
ncbi:MAG TPA: hypothetical protein VF188_01485 [Longimicrobiales bacterium]